MSHKSLGECRELMRRGVIGERGEGGATTASVCGNWGTVAGDNSNQKSHQQQQNNNNNNSSNDRRRQQRQRQFPFGVVRACKKMFKKMEIQRQ